MTSFGRTHRGRLAHIMRPDETKTMCGVPREDLIAIWPSNLGVSQGVAARPTCSTCREAVRLIPTRV